MNLCEAKKIISEAKHPQKKFYKVFASEDLTAFGFQYNLGMNRMENPETLGETFATDDDESYEAGLYFADADNILAYCHYGKIIATVKPGKDANLIYWGNGEYSADVLEILDIRPLWDLETIKALEKEGLNLKAGNDMFMFCAEERGKKEIVSYLRGEI